MKLSGNRTATPRPTPHVLFLIILWALIWHSSCKTPSIPGIAHDTWYISEEMGIAVKFESASRGQYITLNKAIATPQPFRVRQSRNVTRFRLSGHANLQGRLQVYHDQFYLVGANQRISFRQYYTRSFPRAPFRYHDALFSRVTKEEVVYGHAPGFYSSRSIEKRENKSYNQVLFEVAEGITSNLLRRSIPLQMDIYQPEGDLQNNRPLMVLLHAGAFIAGDKGDELVSKLAQDYARRGFVVASVNYRLGYIFLPGRYSNLERAIYSAMQDVRAALRYLSHHHNRYRIDPHFVVLAGHSAGGILTLKTTFMDESEIWPSARGSVLRLQPDLGCLDCAVNDLHGPFTIRGAVNMWGALDDLSVIKPHNRVPLLSIHGDQDYVVPYGSDFPFANVSARASAFFSRRLHGSASILQHTQQLGLEHTLYTFEGWGHEPHFDHDHELIPENYKIIDDLILSFVNHLLIPPFGPITGPQAIGRQDPPAEFWIAQENFKEYFFQCDHCIILRQTPNSARVVWLDAGQQPQLRIAGVGEHGQVKLDTLTVNIR